MKRLLTLLALLPLAAAVADAPAPSKAPAPASASSSLLPARVVRNIKARVKAGDYPTMVVAVVDGKRSHIYTFGKLANGKAPTADTIYQIGSVTKTFTATLLALALDKGAVKLDTPVAKLLPGWTIPSRDGKQITLGELATHYSGLPKIPTNMRVTDAADPYALYDAGKLKAFLASYKLQRDPGAKFYYSNTGFGLLGYALAQRAGTTWAKLLDARILQPLGMTSTTVTFKMPLGPNWSMGHSALTGKTVQPWHLLNAMAGAGAINSTGADMLRYLQANMGQAPAALAKAMHRAHQPLQPAQGKVSQGRKDHIGLAWMIRNDKGGTVFYKGGMTGGYTCFIGLLADHSNGVVVLTNTLSMSPEIIGFATLLSDVKLPTVHQPIHMSTTQLDAYVGHYEASPHFIIHVFRKGDQLYAQATGQGAFPVYPEAADKLFAKVGDIELDFQRDSHGKVKSMVLHQAGHASPPMPRLGKAAAAKLAKANHPHAIHLPVATLKQYVGHYQLASGVVFIITLHDDQLMVQLTGQPAFPVYASAKDQFFYKVVPAQLTFTRDAKGKVDAVILHQGGANLRAPRMQ